LVFKNLFPVFGPSVGCTFLPAKLRLVFLLIPCSCSSRCLFFSSTPQRVFLLQPFLCSMFFLWFYFFFVSFGASPLVPGRSISYPRVFFPHVQPFAFFIVGSPVSFSDPLPPPVTSRALGCQEFFLLVVGGSGFSQITSPSYCANPGLIGPPPVRGGIFCVLP